MMRISTLRPLLALSLSTLMAAAGAQNPPSPPLERIEDVPGAPITVTAPQGERAMTEKREQGRVTEIKVQTGTSTYYLKPNTPAGTAQPGDALGRGERGPQWQVMEFELGSKKKKQKEEEAAAEAPAPPAPAQ